MRSDCGAIALAAPVARSSFNKAGAIPNASSTAHDSAQPLGRYLLHHRLMSSCTGNCGFNASDPHRSTYFNGTPDLLPDGGATASCGGPPPGLIRATRTRVERLQQARDDASDGYQCPRADTETPAATREPARSDRHRAGTRQPHSFRTGPRGVLRAVPNDRTPGDQPAHRLHPVRDCGTPCRCGWPLYQGRDLPGAGVGLTHTRIQANRGDARARLAGEAGGCAARTTSR